MRLIHQAEPAKHETSAESVLDNIMGITAREREMADRHDINGDNSPELLAELAELRTAREQARAAKKRSAGSN